MPRATRVRVNAAKICRTFRRPAQTFRFRFMSFFPVRILLWFVARVALSRLCFDSQPELKDLVDAAGNSYPIGIWVNDWATGHLTARVVQIVIKDQAYRARAWPTWWLHDVRWYSKSNMILQHDLQTIFLYLNKYRLRNYHGFRNCVSETTFQKQYVYI